MKFVKFSLAFLREKPFNHNHLKLLSLIMFMRGITNCKMWDYGIPPRNSFCLTRENNFLFVRAIDMLEL